MRRDLQDKIDHSISLLRKAEKMALRLDPEGGFKWWISGKSFDKFYADEVLQGKLDFGNE